MGKLFFLENKVFRTKVLVALVAGYVYFGTLSALLQERKTRQGSTLFVDEKAYLRDFRFLSGGEQQFAYMVAFTDETAVEVVFVTGQQEQGLVCANSSGVGVLMFTSWVDCR